MKVINFGISKNARFVSVANNWSWFLRGASWSHPPVGIGVLCFAPDLGQVNLGFGSRVVV